MKLRNVIFILFLTLPIFSQTFDVGKCPKSKGPENLNDLLNFIDQAACEFNTVARVAKCFQETGKCSAQIVNNITGCETANKGLDELTGIKEGSNLLDNLLGEKKYSTENFEKDINCTTGNAIKEIIDCYNNSEREDKGKCASSAVKKAYEKILNSAKDFNKQMSKKIIAMESTSKSITARDPIVQPPKSKDPKIIEGLMTKRKTEPALFASKIPEAEKADAVWHEEQRRLAWEKEKAEKIARLERQKDEQERQYAEMKRTGLKNPSACSQARAAADAAKKGSQLASLAGVDTSKFDQGLGMVSGGIEVACAIAGEGDFQSMMSGIMQINSAINQTKGSSYSGIGAATAATGDSSQNNQANGASLEDCIRRVEPVLRAQMTCINEPCSARKEAEQQCRR
ncbi:MAG: hypothetical protein IPQ05_00745 [Leptospiraceae bacterium]|nr:hypothetical protein [Leptospiraceae bacterium]MBL0262405.1 hypothetical protein [Leptospiraceae bacterium]